MYVEGVTPTSMAARLAEYITDPSTIRVRVLEHFGRAPTVEQCRNLRRKVESRRMKHISFAEEKFRNFCATHDGPYEMGPDGIDRCMTCAQERKRAKIEQELNHIRELQRQKELREKRMADRDKRRITESLKGIDLNVKLEHEILMEQICAIFGISKEELIGGRRVHEFVNARIALTKLLKMRGWSFPRIARLFPRSNTKSGFADHTSFIHLHKNYDISARRNPLIARAVEALAR